MFLDKHYKRKSPPDKLAGLGATLVKTLSTSVAENDDGGGGKSLLVGVCLKYTSLPSSAEVTCDREFVINTSPRFFDHMMNVIGGKRILKD